MPTLHHYLRPLLMPTSVAVLGASHRLGSLGRIIVENLLEAEFKGDIYFVNPKHRKVLGRKCHASIYAIGKPVELALIAVPCAAVTSVLADASRAGVKAAILFSAPPGDEAVAGKWQRDVMATARKLRIRILGPHAFGVIRTDAGFNATLGAIGAHPGRLALIAQSGAVCTAMLNFAAPLGLGFSTVVALGGAYDVDFGELLDALLQDPGTDAILLYVEQVRDARRFLSALRAAARTKPVLVLRAGRSMESTAQEGDPDAPSRDVVFDAAMKRAGTVRVATYAQLFAAARILSTGRIPRGDHLAIVTNGHGPGTLAADCAFDRGVALARFSRKTEEALLAILPEHIPLANPVNVRGDAPAERLASAVGVVLNDPSVDAVLAIHVQRPLVGATDSARAVAAVARTSGKPVLGAWLGTLDNRDVRSALEAGGVPNLITPETAVEAFSFLAAYRRNQEWLLEVAPPQPEPQPLNVRLLNEIRDRAVAASRTVLDDIETHQLLAAFGLPIAPAALAATLEEAQADARRMGYPVSIKLETPALFPHAPPPLRTQLRDGRMLAKAWAELEKVVRPQRRPGAIVPVVVRKEQKAADIAVSRDVAIGVHTDAVFGPVITFGNGGSAALVDRDRSVLLPPLNRRLALDVIERTRIAAALRAGQTVTPSLEALAHVLLQVSSLVCALPWIRSLRLDPVRVGERGAVIGGAHIVIDPKREVRVQAYRHMAIHPYPIEWVEDVSLADGTPMHLRPIRPEDAALERQFVEGLSEQTRYFRFFYRLQELTPAMLARFTQVDYDRELALIALIDTDTAPRIVGVARYIENPDGESAEFAVVVGDAYQARGVGRILMRRLIAAAKRRGLARLEGAVLRNNPKMIRFTEGLGFDTHDDPHEPEQVNMVLDLA